MSNRILMQNDKYEMFDLGWDTDFFGVKSARVNLKSELTENDKHEVIDLIKDYEFVTIANINNKSLNNEWLGNSTTAFLTNMNIQFEKNICKVDINDSEVSIVDKYNGNSDKLIDLARDSFEYSRFFNDTKLPFNKAKSIYVKWVDSSLVNSNKKFVLATNSKGIVGFIIFNVNNENKCATIELIAVDKNTLGKGYGKRMIKTLESYLFDFNILSLKVGTQTDNIRAVQFYNSCEFKYSKCSSIYHLWNLGD